MNLAFAAMLSTLFSADPSAVDLNGPRMVVTQLKPDGVFVRAGAPTQAQAEVTLTGQKRVQGDDLAYGDLARLTARFAVGSDLYWLSLDAAGFPPRDVSGTPSRTLPPPAFGFPLQGGVMLDREVLGATGIGPTSISSAHASVAVFGPGQIARNRRPLSNRARIQVFAVTEGVDGLVPAGGMLIVVDGIPRDREPTGTLSFVVNSVQVQVNGVRVQPEPPVVADDNTGVGGSGTAGVDAPNASNGLLSQALPFGGNVEIVPPTYVSTGGPLAGPFPTPLSKDLVNSVNGNSAASVAATPSTGSIFPPGMSTQTPSAPTAGTPSAPQAGTPSAPRPSSPLFVSNPPVTGPENQAAAGSNASAFPNGNFPGTASAKSSVTTSQAEASGSNLFASPGVPMAPTPLNDSPATPLLETPSPLNAEVTAPRATSAPLTTQTIGAQTISGPTTAVPATPRAGAAAFMHR